MKQIIPFLITILLNITAYGQQKYSKVRIFVDDVSLIELENIGIPADHGHRKKNTWLDTDLSSSQIQTLIDHQFDYDILIDDVQAFYIERSNQVSTRSDRDNCDGNVNTGFEPEVPTHFNLGTYAGFYTYQEFLDELDEMHTEYPNLITQREAIDTFTTHEGRPLYWLRISDNPTVDEAENEVFYSAIHHAREPASLSQLIFYMWYLLENYGTNDEVTYLLDHTELYFVPMINPDGYIENEVNNPNGGGMHRKNKRNIGTTNPGVDLNRNYAYHWNESGTTQDVDGDTYAGTNGFSEPETQAIKHFCETRNFEFALNAHSYSNLLLFPLGYASAAFANDHDYFQAFSNHQVKFSGYVAEKASNLYPAAGDSDDWMYADDLATKPKIYALTPEIGSSSDGFWPPQSKILQLCKENVWMNLILAHMPHVYGVGTETDPSQITSTTGYFHYSYERLGLESGPVTISISPILGIQTVGLSNTHTLNLMDIENDSISYTLPNGLAFGDEIKYILESDFGQWSRLDTITKIYGVNGSIAFIDNGNTILNWSGDWGNTPEYFVSPDFSISDSPNSNYSNGENSSFELIENVSFNGATYAYAKFNARWNIEADFDYVQFMISTDDGNSWTPLCGNYTNLGTNDQDEDLPLYDGVQGNWILEEIDLGDYLGENNPKFKFRLISDGFVTEDGFAFDDFKIYTDGYALGLEDEISRNSISIYPNPSQTELYIESDQNIIKVEVYNQLGQKLETLNINQTIEKINTNKYLNGIYFLKCFNHSDQFVVKKFSVNK